MDSHQSIEILESYYPFHSLQIAGLKIKQLRHKVNPGSWYRPSPSLSSHWDPIEEVRDCGLFETTSEFVMRVVMVHFKD